MSFESTNIYCISDLHLELYTKARDLYDILKLPAADVLILAGDIGYPCNNDDVSHADNYKELLILFKQNYKHVLLVPGNHEYYQAVQYDRKKCFDALQIICQETKVQLLEKSFIDINGIRFYGTTLWSAIDSHTVLNTNDFQYAFNDRVDYLEEFIDSYKWLRDILQRDVNLPKKVVITHHLPSTRLIHKKYVNHPRNTGFYTNILSKMQLHNVKLWLCGHTHESIIIKYGDTKIIVNPYGYPYEQKTRDTQISVDPIGV